MVGNVVTMSAASGGYVTMGDALPMNHCGDFSVVIWVKTTTAGDQSESPVVGRHLSGSYPGYFICLNMSGGGGQLDKAFFYNNLGPQSPVSTTTVNDAQWHQIAAVYHADGDAEIYPAYLTNRQEKGSENVLKYW